MRVYGERLFLCLSITDESKPTAVEECDIKCERHAPETQSPPFIQLHHGDSGRSRSSQQHHQRTNI